MLIGNSLTKTFHFISGVFPIDQTAGQEEFDALTSAYYRGKPTLKLFEILISLSTSHRRYSIIFWRFAKPFSNLSWSSFVSY